MRRWCVLSNERPVSPGEFTETDLLTLSGQPIHSEMEFLEELTERLMLRYESQPFNKPLAFKSLPTKRPARTRDFYERQLLRRDTRNGVLEARELITWASETLALWIEQDMFTTELVDGNPPHGAEPAFDGISLVLDSSGELRLRLLQVKATENRLRKNCNDALTGFDGLEKGHYDSQLLNRLTLLEERRKLPASMEATDLWTSSERQYKVYGVHSDDRRSMQILTRYKTVVAGNIARRSCCLVFLDDWSCAWQTLEDLVRAKLP